MKQTIITEESFSALCKLMRLTSIRAMHGACLVLCQGRTQTSASIMSKCSRSDLSRLVCRMREVLYLAQTASKGVR
jgi:hypothetical protein